MTPLDQLDLSHARVLDGGMATELERLGSDISGPLWSAHVLRDSPQSIEAVHASYLEAGADCLLTASYQVSRQGFSEAGYSVAETAEALRQSVRLAELARSRYQSRHPRPVLIAASLGPYGAALHNGAEYHGNYTISFQDLVQFHGERLAVLRDTNADLVAFETIPSREEAHAIIEALRRFPEMPAWISFTCRDDRHVAHGELLNDCASMLEPNPQIVAIGVNCTAPRFLTPLLAGLRSVTRKPIVAYPNSGETWDAACRCWHGTSDPAEFGTLARQWLQAGASLIGGCCRTGPEHIRAIHAALVGETAPPGNHPL